MEWEQRRCQHRVEQPEPSAMNQQQQPVVGCPPWSPASSNLPKKKTAPHRARPFPLTCFPHLTR